METLKAALQPTVFSVLHFIVSLAIAFVDNLAALLGMLIGTSFNSRLDRLTAALGQATSQEEWTAIAKEIDAVSGAQAWRANPASPIYDHKLLFHRLVRLREAAGDVAAMMYLLRGGLLRNLGGLADLRLYRRSLLGTKNLIEAYLAEVCSQLVLVADDKEMPLQSRLEFFTDTRQSFGNTALILSGGTTFGAFHLGVARTLARNNLLPRIVSGSGIGALIAALVGVHTTDELPDILTAEGIDLGVFEGRRSTGSTRRRLTRFLKTGNLFDVSVLEVWIERTSCWKAVTLMADVRQEFVRANVGDMTFAQAFARTGRALNIVVSSSRTNEVPQLLNHLTAPSVLIWSAACCSAVDSGLFERSVLLAKDSAGHAVVFHPSRNTTYSETTESPESRLQEMFNCNHFIVSSADPMTALLQPGDPNKGYSRLISLLRSEIRFRLSQLSHLGLLPHAFRSTDRQYQGHIVVQPSFQLSDLTDFFSSPSKQLISRYILKGEKATWPLLAVIRARTGIEFELSRCVNALSGSRHLQAQTKAQRMRTKSVN
ncbi:hypothetical protein DFJ74DRAFT_622123 [Hyaloraphidium curvatum]|nr:hypothetical protein DFJ74DRAFT_622123 [Hyaloraphidium curvatum]